MSLTQLKKVAFVLAVSTVAFSSCKKEYSNDDPFPPEYNSTLYYASDNRTLFSVDVATKKTKWEFVADAAIKASPTMFRNSVILVSQSGKMYKLNKITGEVEQQRDFGVPVISTPVVYNDKLIVCTTDGKMIALDGNDITAAALWQRTGLGAMTGSATVERIEATDQIGVINANDANEVFAINEEDGAILWRITLPQAGSVVSSPTASPYTIYVTSTNGRLYSLRTVNGAVNWNYLTGGPIVSSPISIGGNVMFGSYDMNFYSVDSLTGEMRWKVPAGDKIESTPVYDNQYVYYGANDQYIYCVDVIDGLEEWKKRTFSVVRSSPVVFDNKVYVGSFDQNMYILDAETGKEKGLLEVFGQMDCSPMIDNITRVYYPPVSGNYFLK